MTTVTTREEIAAAIRALDARLASLRERILEAPEQPLREGTWTVRDALSHVAARAHALPNFRAWLARTEAQAQQQPGAPAPAFDIHAVNAGQVRERMDRTPMELLEEIREGHRKTIAGLAEIDDATLARSYAVQRDPGHLTGAEMLLLSVSRHEHSHLDQIEQALSA